MSDCGVELVRIFGQNGHFWGRKVVKNDQKMTNFESVPNRSRMVLGWVWEGFGWFWEIWGGFERFWVVLGGFWVALGCFGRFWEVWGWFWEVLGGFGWL